MYIYVNICYMYTHVCVCVLSHFSCVWFFSTSWTVARHAPLSMRFSRQEHWSGSPCPPPGDLPNLGMETVSPGAPALQVDSSPLSHRESPYMCVYICKYIPMPIYVQRERGRAERRFLIVFLKLGGEVPEVAFLHFRLPDFQKLFIRSLIA